jgi:hypothetical protein
MSENIQDSVRRTRAYWYIDGISELCMGVLFILLGIVLLIEGPALKGSNLAVVMASIRYIVIIGGTFGIGIALRYFKGNLTYPRTGYVIYRKPTLKEMGPALITVVVLAMLLSEWVQADMPLKLSLFIWLIAGLTGFFAYLFISWGVETGFRRFYALAALTIVSGLMIAGLGIGYALRENNYYMFIGPGMFFTALGIIACISGGLTLRRYLQQTQAQALDGEPA